jgi:ankyrin repeat protein
MYADIKSAVTVWLMALLAIGTVAAAGSDTRLVDAVERKDQAAIGALLKERADVNARQPDGATALQWAAHWDDSGTVDRLLRAGADVNAANDHGVTALALACENGNAATVDKLLKAGANANAAVSTGETALMTAARGGNVGAVQMLLAHGAKANAREGSHGQTALMWAVAHAHSDVVKVLVEAGADINARSEVRTRTVHTGSRYGDRGADKGALRMDQGGFTPLLFAAREGDIESARMLLDAGANVNDAAPNGASALAVATLSGHGTFAALLLDKGADPLAAGAGYTALHAAVLRGDQALVKALLAHHANPNAQLTKGTPSRYYSKDYAFNEALTGATPFWLSARYGDVEALGLLAAAGADPRHAMADGTTALMAAIAANPGFGVGNRREQYLSPADAAAKAEGEDERTTLATARAVIALGADVHAANQAGDTALHMAASQGLTTVAQLLVEKGASLEARNKRGLTPLGAATAPRQRNPLAAPGPDIRIGTAELLRKLGAKE